MFCAIDACIIVYLSVLLDTTHYIHNLAYHLPTLYLELLSAHVVCLECWKTPLHLRK